MQTIGHTSTVNFMLVISSYLAHVHVSSSGDVPVHTDDIAVVLEDKKEDKNADENNNLEVSLL